MVETLFEKSLEKSCVRHCLNDYFIRIFQSLIYSAGKPEGCIQKASFATRHWPKSKGEMIWRAPFNFEVKSRAWTPPTLFPAQLSDQKLARQHKMAGGDHNDESGKVLLRRYFWYRYDDIGFPYRVNHATATYEDKITDENYVYLFGGYHRDEEAREQCSNCDYRFVFRSVDIDVHRFDVRTKQWSLVKTKSQKDNPFLAPSAKSRYGHSVLSYNGRMYMFGGQNDNDKPMSAVACFDVASNSWINCDTIGDAPEGRYGHSSTLIGSTMFIHGGFCIVRSEVSNDLYGLNLETLFWTKYPNNGARITGRDFHTITGKCKDEVILFGGSSDETNPLSSFIYTYDDKFYCYNLKEYKWTQFATTGYKPEGRRSHIAMYCRGNVIYFGGFNCRKDKHFADIFILNTTSHHITEVAPWGERPFARRRPACALIGTQLLVCGGGSPRKTAGMGESLTLIELDDTYILNLMPSLQELCTACVLTHKVDYSLLPPHLCAYIEKLQSMDMKNKII